MQSDLFINWVSIELPLVMFEREWSVDHLEFLVSLLKAQKKMELTILHLASKRFDDLYICRQ